MAERRISDEALARALERLEPAYPPTPAIGPAVAARLETDRAAGARPPFPGVATWSRRRLLVVAAIGLLALLGLAFGARLVLGAAEVRVVPGLTPSGPPVRPSELGTPLAMDELAPRVGFPLALPSGPGPDASYVVRTADGHAALLVWRASERLGTLPGTPWGLALLEMPSDAEIVLKDVNRFEDVQDVRVGGRPGYWIDVPHQLTVDTAEGSRSFTVRANVLIWAEGDVTFRLETALPRAEALALAASIG